MNLKMLLINETKYDYSFINNNIDNENITLDFVHEINDINNFNYDVCFVDKKESAPRIIDYIKKNIPHSSIYVISDYDNPNTLKTFLKIGIDGFLDKEIMTNDDITNVINKELTKKSKIEQVKNKLFKFSQISGT